VKGERGGESQRPNLIAILCREGYRQRAGRYSNPKKFGSHLFADLSAKAKKGTTMRTFATKGFDEFFNKGAFSSEKKRWEWVQY